MSETNEATTKAEAEVTLTPDQIAEIQEKIKAKRERDSVRVLDKDDPFYLAGFLTFGPEEFEVFTPAWARKAGKSVSYNIRPFSREAVRKIDAARSVEENQAAVIEGLKGGALTGWTRETFKGTPIQFSVDEIDNIPLKDLEVLGGRCYAYATGILPEEREGFE